MRFRSSFDEREKDFVSKMERIQRQGYDFPEGSRLALEAKFGGAAAVLMDGMSESTRNDPSLFMGQLVRKFGNGAMGFLEPVMDWADKGLFPPLAIGQSAYAAIVRQLPPGGEGEGQIDFVLHQHRLKDDEGKYSDEYD